MPKGTIPTIATIEEAHAIVNKNIRRVAPEWDDVETVRGDIQRHRSRILNAITTRPEDVNEWQRDQWKRLRSKYTGRSPKADQRCRNVP